MIDYDCIRVVLIDMPPSINGFTISDGFDYYTIVLNPRLSQQKQEETYAHEISHIMNGDFSRMQDINRDLLEEMTADQLETIRHEENVTGSVEGQKEAPSSDDLGASFSLLC